MSRRTGQGATGFEDGDDVERPVTNPPKDSGYARRVSRKRRSRNEDGEQDLLLMEGAATQEDPTLLWVLFLSCIWTTTGGLIYAFSTGSMGIVTEVTSESIDMISYGINLCCVYMCKGESLMYKEKKEFQCGMISTVLLMVCALRILVVCIAQIVCASDKGSADGHIACALVQERPSGAALIGMSFFMLSSYVPLAFYVFLGKGDTESFDAKEDVNKASALLHVQTDVLQQITFIIAGMIMAHYPETSVEIDSTASMLVVFMLCGLTAKMWHKYYSDLETPTP